MSPDSVANTIDKALESALEKHLALGADTGNGITPKPLADSIRYSLLAPGKRIRPRLLLACAEMLAVPGPTALSAALALEMVHCYTLIHDDLPCMDNDDFRRGRPSNHKVFGEATALLAGDSLMVLAIETLLDAQGSVPAPHLLSAVKRLCWASGPRGVIGGQAAEPLLNEKSTLDDLRRMFAGKTGALFSASLLLPKDLAGLSHGPRSESLESVAIDRFAKELGLAFQVADDLEDAADEAKTPTNIHFYLSEKAAKDQTASALGKAMEDLLACWGATAKPLVEIAQEVLRKFIESPS